MSFSNALMSEKQRYPVDAARQVEAERRLVADVIKKVVDEFDGRSMHMATMGVAPSIAAATKALNALERHTDPDTRIHMLALLLTELAFRARSDDVEY